MRHGNWSFMWMGCFKESYKNTHTERTEKCRWKWSESFVSMVVAVENEGGFLMSKIAFRWEQQMLSAYKIDFQPSPWNNPNLFFVVALVHVKWLEKIRSDKKNLLSAERNVFLLEKYTLYLQRKFHDHFFLFPFLTQKKKHRSLLKENRPLHQTVLNKTQIEWTKQKEKKKTTAQRRFMKTELATHFIRKNQSIAMSPMATKTSHNKMHCPLYWKLKKKQWRYSEGSMYFISITNKYKIV